MIVVNFGHIFCAQGLMNLIIRSTIRCIWIDVFVVVLQLNSVAVYALLYLARKLKEKQIINQQTWTEPQVKIYW